MERRIPLIFFFLSELQESPVILMGIVNDNKSCFFLKLWRFSHHWQLTRFSGQKNCRYINYDSSCDPKTFTFAIVQPILFSLKFRAAVRMQWRMSYSKSTSLMSQLSKTEFSSAASIMDLLICWVLRLFLFKTRWTKSWNQQVSQTENFIYVQRFADHLLRWLWLLLKCLDFSGS